MPNFDIIERKTRFGKPSKKVQIMAPDRESAMKKYLDFQGGFKTAEYLGPHKKRRK